MLRQFVKELFRRVSPADRPAPATSNDCEALFRRATSCVGAGNIAEARQHLHKIIALQPGHADSLYELGRLAAREGRSDEATRWFAQAISANPGAARYHNSYGNLLYARGEFEEAARLYAEAIRVDPEFALAHANMGMVLCELADTEAGLTFLRRAIALDPELHEAHNSIGLALVSRGDVETGIACLRRAVALKPDSPDLHSNLVMSLGFARTGNQEQFAERRCWQRSHVEPLQVGIPWHDNSADAGRKLHIGYVSADFRQHSAACAFGPMLLHYDRDDFDVSCYSNSLREDTHTARYRGAVDRWRNICGVPDSEAEKLVREDRIDILVDLSGHTVGNRLLLFARKPAPVQVTAWGGVTGTGLDAIDYIFADAVMIPEQIHGYFSEEVVYLPCPLTYMPHAELPPVARLPASERGFVTFGYFNNYIKLSAAALAVWARLLGSIPNSRLLFKAKEFDRLQPRDRVVRVFTAAGIPPERLSFLGASPWYEHLEAHGGVDIVLDPFPNVGGISTLEALSMGTPVVTLKGETPVNRISASTLTAVGLGDWVAETSDQYLSIAGERSRDIPGLECLRAVLRDRLTASPAGNPGNYVRAVEAIYRGLWRRWCEGRPA
jgi:predicted O-linked N-acetylglucosamine transferase (SPINDLY family)